MNVKIDLGVMRSGEFVTKYSNWRERYFKSIDDAYIFAKGVVCGLEYKWKMAACRIRFEDGMEDVIY